MARIIALVLALGSALCSMGPAWASDAAPLSVTLNMARVLRVSGPVVTVIIGNPGIADVTIEDATTLVLTGKSYGLTNLIALDASGNALADAVVEVVAADEGLVTIYSGLKRGTLHCAPACQPVVMVGDDYDYSASIKGSADLLSALAHGQ
jgi:hypothetical protein